jgi:hypothetical protein
MRRDMGRLAHMRRSRSQPGEDAAQECRADQRTAGQIANARDARVAGGGAGVELIRHMGSAAALDEGRMNAP